LKLYRIFLPKVYNNGKPIEKEKIRKVTDDLTKKFGGYTLNPLAYLPLMEGVGTSNKTHKIYTEQVICIELFIQDTFNNQSWMKAFTEMIRQEFKQEELFVIVQNAEIIK
jgi:hypothetical protein